MDTTETVADSGTSGLQGRSSARRDLELLAQQLVDRARAEGLELVGPNGLLAGVTKQVVETALEAEMREHLGYGPHERALATNVRNGRSSKTLQTDVGPVQIEVPWDRAGTFDPRIVPKHSRRLDGFDEAIISLYAKGLTTGEIQAHLSEIYGADVSRETISKVTDAVAQELAEWQNRPLDSLWPVIFIDAIVVKIRDGAVANRPVYVACGINLDGERDVLGMWVGKGGEGAKHWLSVLTELRNRGIEDVLIVACDGLKGLDEAIEATWPQATVQTCVVHLVRQSLRYAARQDWQKITTDLKPIYAAPTVDAAAARFEDFAAKWETKYPAIVHLWRDAWERFTPFLAFPAEIRRVIYTTNSIESLNSRFRHATRRRGHFPNEQAALKVLYLSVQEREKNRPNPTGIVSNWKRVLNSFVLHYGDRIELYR
jgi:transposase-like protein